MGMVENPTRDLMNSGTWAVITSIYEPRVSTLELLNLGWSLVVVADSKTPCDKWQAVEHENFHFLTLEMQRQLFPDLDRLLGAATYARKNFGYLYAIKMGAQSIWDTDDDTFVRDQALKNFINLNECPRYQIRGSGYFNPYTQFAQELNIWPRGYPLRLVKEGRKRLAPNLSIAEQSETGFDVLQTLVDEEPDVDAIFRLTINDLLPSIPVDDRIFVCGKGVVAPANTQSTLWTNRQTFSFLYVPKWVSFRFCDILKMYVAQSQVTLAYAGFWTRQERNPHDYLIDFESEIDLYLNTELVVTTLMGLGSTNLSNLYEALVDIGVCKSSEVRAAEVFSNYIRSVSA
jgi:hypothetical protein